MMSITMMGRCYEWVGFAERCCIRFDFASRRGILLGCSAFSASKQRARNSNLTFGGDKTKRVSEKGAIDSNKNLAARMKSTSRGQCGTEGDKIIE